MLLVFIVVFIVAIVLLSTMGRLLRKRVPRRRRRPGYRRRQRAPFTDPTGSLEQISVDGTVRSYYLHLPARAAAGKLPLLLAFHGGGGDGRRFAMQTGFNAVADRAGFAVVYPDALGLWNDGRPEAAGEVDDIAFIKVLIAHLVTTRNIDSRRVYAAGASNGGMFTQRLACELSDQIAAFASVIAAMPAAYARRCKPCRPVALLMINGTDDPLMPWQGGKIGGDRLEVAGGWVLSAPETAAFWVRHNGCRRKTLTETAPTLQRSQGTQVRIITFPHCRHNVSVKLFQIEGGGHTWPGSPLPMDPHRARRSGRTNYDINASAVIWEFMKQYTLE